jgi:hypothetical protein
MNKSFFPSAPPKPRMMATLPIMFAPKLMLQLRGQLRRGGKGVPFSVVNRSDSGRPLQRRSVSSFLSGTKDRPDDDTEDDDAASSSLFHSSDQKKILRKCRDLHASIMDLNERVSFLVLREGCGDHLVSTVCHRQRHDPRVLVVRVLSVRHFRSLFLAVEY